MMFLRTIQCRSAWRLWQPSLVAEIGSRFPKFEHQAKPAADGRCCVQTVGAVCKSHGLMFRSPPRGLYLGLQDRGVLPTCMT